jgi:hypothetical protein
MLVASALDADQWTAQVEAAWTVVDDLGHGPRATDRR